MTYLTIPRLMNSFFSEFDNDTTANTVTTPYHTADYDEETGTISLKIEIPGAPKDHVKLSASDSKVSLTTKTGKEDEKTGYYEKDFFFRHKIKPESVKAEYKDGILTVKVEKDLPKKFDIQIA
ncbi:MAG: Hsp20/alpha crystallin family protein [Candidatus Hodarchaeales archaeon]|jgi:HSP20 family molecular chaperone IbpA